MLEFFRQTQHRAAREYTCDLCGRTIRKGVQYVYEVSKYNGMLNDFRRHIHCDALLHAWSAETGGGEYTVEEIGDFLRDGVCSHCDLFEMDECDQTECFSCDGVLGALLRPAELAAAKESVLENEGTFNE